MQLPMTRHSERWFRLGTAVFALAVVLIVAGIGVELYRQSTLAIEKFGLKFWLTDVWDPVVGDFGARPFIWGTLYSSVLALLLATPVSLGIAIFLTDLCRSASPSLRRPGSGRVPAPRACRRGRPT